MAVATITDSTDGKQFHRRRTFSQTCLFETGVLATAHWCQLRDKAARVVACVMEGYEI